jgi:hypothetical protein
VQASAIVYKATYQPLPSYTGKISCPQEVAVKVMNVNPTQELVSELLEVCDDSFLAVALVAVPGGSQSGGWDVSF